MHRNVLFRNATVLDLPVSARLAERPLDLWRHLDTACNSADNACEVLAIPHNSNLSAGEIFTPAYPASGSLEEQAEIAALRKRTERLAEIYQVKGDSECRNGLYRVGGAPDEFCEFEKVRRKSEALEDCRDEVGEKGMAMTGCVSRRSFLRFALTEGLVERQRLQVNPFEMGIIAADELPASICDSPNMISAAYASGIPMGSTLIRPRDASSPDFLVTATADGGTTDHPGGLLQRLQVIKGWADKNGILQHRVYDVAGDPNNGASVDTKTCQPQGEGFKQLCTVWHDPDYDPTQQAVYYGRVLQNPSCRWNAYQCAEFVEGQRPKTCDDADYPKTLQERAWTSPIWIYPESSDGSLSQLSPALF